MKKLLALDVDGVLNCAQCHQGSMFNLGDDHMVLLHQIVTQTDCDILLSSTWRLNRESKRNIRFAFNQYEIKHWIDQTPDFSDKRHEEIQKWLIDNVKEPCNVVVLDDDSDAGLQKTVPNIISTFVQTTWQNGLTKTEADLVLTAFGK